MGFEVSTSFSEFFAGRGERRQEGKLSGIVIRSIGLTEHKEQFFSTCVRRKQGINF
jgi:hypothetical protein